LIKRAVFLLFHPAVLIARPGVWSPLMYPLRAGADLHLLPFMFSKVG
ncbi:MAG: hypothetical protein JWP57_4288, partial [Spirosoma sp.]|nr:hypothetical protein [Spirosoma sp.]